MLTRPRFLRTASDLASYAWLAKMPKAVVQHIPQTLLAAVPPRGAACLTGPGTKVVTMAPAHPDRFFNTARRRWRAVVPSAHLQRD